MTETPAGPLLPACHHGEAHNFQPLNEKTVYCTKCAAHVKFTKAPKK
jgi:hypothetical protein